MTNHCKMPIKNEHDELFAAQNLLFCKLAEGTLMFPQLICIKTHLIR